MMAQPPVIIPTRTPSQVIEGTRDEITAYLNALNGDKEMRLTLIVPGDALPAGTQVHDGMTFAEILAPAEKGFEESGMTEEALDDFIEAEVKTYRVEKQTSRRA